MKQLCIFVVQMIEAQVIQVSKFTNTPQELVQLISQFQGQHTCIVTMFEQYPIRRSVDETITVQMERVLQVETLGHNKYPDISYQINTRKVLDTILGVEVVLFNYQNSDRPVAHDSIHAAITKRGLQLILEWPQTNEYRPTIKFNKRIGNTADIETFRTAKIQFFEFYQQRNWLELFNLATEIQCTFTISAPKLQQPVMSNHAIIKTISTLTNRSLNDIIALLNIQRILNVSLKPGFIHALHKQRQSMTMLIAREHQPWLNAFIQYNVEGTRAIIELNRDQLVIITPENSHTIQLQNDLAQQWVALATVVANSVIITRVQYADGVIINDLLYQMLLGNQLVTMINNSYDQSNMLVVYSPVEKVNSVVDIKAAIEREFLDSNIRSNGVSIVSQGQLLLGKRVNNIRVFMCKVEKDQVPNGHSRDYVNMIPYILRVRHETQQDQLYNQPDDFGTIPLRSIYKHIKPYYWRDQTEDQQLSYHNHIAYVRYDGQAELSNPWVLQSAVPLKENGDVEAVDTLMEADIKLVNTTYPASDYLLQDSESSIYSQELHVINLLQTIVQQIVTKLNQQTLQICILGEIIPFTDIVSVVNQRYKVFAICAQYTSLAEYILQAYAFTKQYPTITPQFSVVDTNLGDVDIRSDVVICSHQSIELFTYNDFFKHIEMLQPMYIIYITKPVADDDSDEMFIKGSAQYKRLQVTNSKNVSRIIVLVRTQ